jgi:hypothetical protein
MPINVNRSASLIGSQHWGCGEASLFFRKYKFLSIFSITPCKAIESVWKTLNFSVENSVENLYRTQGDRGKGN